MCKSSGRSARRLYIIIACLLIASWSGRALAISASPLDTLFISTSVTSRSVDTVLSAGIYAQLDTAKHISHHLRPTWPHCRNAV